MPPEPIGNMVRQWMEVARRDLAAGEALLGQADLSAQASFFAQQAAEKSLKALLLWHQRPFKKEHDIRYLGELVLKAEPDIDASILDEAAGLSPFAVTFRYPPLGGQTLPIDEAREALEIAKRLFAEVVSLLPPQCRP